jgi:hypothetical protein
MSFHPSLCRGFRLGALATLVALGAGCDATADEGPPPGAPAGQIALELGPASLSLPVGESVQLQAVPTMTGGSPVADPYSVEWTSSDSTVATVTDGLVVALKTGSAEVRATATLLSTGSVASDTVAVTVESGDGGMPVTCGEGAVTSTCQCGTAVVSDGFCCEGVVQGTACDPDPPGEVYFSHDFEGVEVNDYALTNWPIRDNGMVVDDYLQNRPPFALQEITQDPESTGRAVLRSETVDWDGDDSCRAQYDIIFGDDVNLDVYHTSHRVWFSPDISDLSSYPGNISGLGSSDWVTLFEIWNGVIPELGSEPGGSCRWSFGLNKAAGAGQPLRFEILSDYMTDANMYQELWPKQVNTTATVPLGQWVTLDMYMRRGEGSAGHLKITITPDGGSPEVLFDIQNHTVYPGYAATPLLRWQPFKLYASDPVLDFLPPDKGFYAYYNDFAWYVN